MLLKTKKVKLLRVQGKVRESLKLDTIILWARQMDVNPPNG